MVEVEARFMEINYVATYIERRKENYVVIKMLLLG